MATNNPSQQRLLAIAAIIIVALLALNAFLLYNKYKQDKVIQEQQAGLSEAQKLQEELDKQYNEALADLEDMRGTNEELNAIIDQQKLELTQQKNRIEQLIREGKELNKARSEMSKLSVQVKEYIAQIEQLKAENQRLSTERQEFAEKTEMLTQNLDSAQAKALALAGERDMLSTEKLQLSSEKAKLSETVTFASVVKVENVSVTGMKERSSGKTVKKKYAKNIDQLKVCFETTANEVTRPGVEQFYVRILNPVGETMAIDELGSGLMRVKDTGEEVRYTSLREYDYQNDEAQICFNWDPNLGAFSKGKYTVEVYNKGYLAGKGEFQLK